MPNCFIMLLQIVILNFKKIILLKRLTLLMQTHAAIVNLQFWCMNDIIQTYLMIHFPLFHSYLSFPARNFCHSMWNWHDFLSGFSEYWRDQLKWNNLYTHQHKSCWCNYFQKLSWAIFWVRDGLITTTVYIVCLCRFRFEQKCLPEQD